MRALAAVAAVVVSLLAGPAAAGPPSDRVREYTDLVVRTLEDPALQAGDRRLAVRRIATEIFDLPETARRALGPHWRARTPAEREEFVQMFADLLERTYIAQIERYGGERLRIVGEKVEGERAVVQGRVVTKTGAEVPVEARMRLRAGQWLIYDVAVENVSLVANYRTQFDRIIRTSSYAELVRRLRDRAEFLNERDRKNGRVRPAS
jgi:phospholipid transport system substrate-binding protein